MKEDILLQIDTTWTLFLDRDGVINVELPGDYVKNWEEFVFCTHALQALETFSKLFKTIVVVSNQRGVSKGIMTLNDLHSIHTKMVQEISDNNGRIDKIYFSTALSDDDHSRKPNIGMAFNAKDDFKHIDFNKSIMIGNKLSDMQFGKKAGMITVMVDEKNTYPTKNDLIDFKVGSMYEFSKKIQ
jgi:histidinol phosphatase-like enzyme